MKNTIKKRDYYLVYNSYYFYIVLRIDWQFMQEKVVDCEVMRPFTAS
jgi:hypothetical protein